MINSHKKNNKDFILKLLPIIILTSIVPLIMIVKLYQIPSDIQNVLMKGSQIVDIYSYYKMIAVSLSGLLMTIILAREIISNNKLINKFKENKIIAISIFLLLLTIATTIFSPYKSVVFVGLPERFEGFFVFYTYLISILYIPLILKPYRHTFVYIYAGMCISAVFISIIGVLEFYGYYIIEQEWFKIFSVFGELKNMNVDIQYSLKVKTLSSSLYNPNYVGSYMVMLIFSTISLLFLKSKDAFKRIVLSLAIILFSLALIFSKSVAGYLSLFLTTAIFTIIIVVRNRKASSKLIAASISTILLIALTTGIYLNNNIVNSIVLNNDSHKNLEDIQINNGILSLTYKGKVLNISLNPNKDGIVFYDDDNNIIDYTYNQENNIITTETETYRQLMIYYNPSTNLYTLRTAGAPRLNLNLFFNSEGVGYIDYYGNIITDSSNINYQRWGLNGYESLASGRGYIWSLSIPLLKDNLLLGSGSDTYALIVPQDDIVGKLAYLRNQNALIDKPHNLYLQLGITQGVLFTLIFVGLVIYLIIQLIRDLLKYGDKVSIERIAIMCAVIAYMIAGIANDSTVGTGPVFWSLLGISILHYVDDKESLGHH